MRRRILSIVMMVLVALNALLTLHTPAHADTGSANPRTFGDFIVTASAARPAR